MNLQISCSDNYRTLFNNNNNNNNNNPVKIVSVTLILQYCVYNFSILPRFVT